MRANLLVVDDDTALRRLFSRVLGSIGHVDEAADVDEAIAKLDASHYDFVVLDLGLRGHDGIDVLRALGDGPNADTPVCVISGDASEETRARALGAGAAQYLTKPLRLAELTELAQDFLSRQGT